MQSPSEGCREQRLDVGFSGSFHHATVQGINERERGELEPEDLRSECESEQRRKRRHTALNESDPIKGK